MDREGVFWVLDQLGIDRIRNRNGKNVSVSCPLAKYGRRGHNSEVDYRPSLSILINPNMPSKVKCHACKFRGELSSLIRTINRYSKDNLNPLLKKVIEMEDIDPEWLANSITDYEHVEERYVERIIDESEILNYTNKTHGYFVNERGLSIDTLKSWGTGYDHDNRRGFFPVRNIDSKLVGAVGRSINDYIKPKYYNYFEFNKGRYLYGEDKCTSGSIGIIVEGIIDTLKLWQLLYDRDVLNEYSVVSILGSDPTEHQLNKIVKLFDVVILFFDNDGPGWSGTMKAVKFLGKIIQVRAVSYPYPVGGDPDELIRRGYNVFELIQNSSLVF